MEKDKENMDLGIRNADLSGSLRINEKTLAEAFKDPDQFKLFKGDKGRKVEEAKEFGCSEEQYGGCIYNEEGICKYNTHPIKQTTSRACYEDERRADIDAEHDYDAQY